MNGFFFRGHDITCPLWEFTAWLFQDYDSDKVFSIQDDHISHLLPTFYQDMIVRVYSKKPELVCGK